MNEQEEVVALYKKFDKYALNTKEQLLCHVEKSFELKQYKIHRKNGEVVAFTNWAFLNKKHEEHYTKTGQILYHFWNSGDRCWIVDSICHDDSFDAVYEWAKRYFTQQLGIGVTVSWLRVESTYKVSDKQTRHTKKEYLNG